MRLHVDQASGTCLDRVGAQHDLCVSAKDLDCGRHWRSMCRQLLAWREAEYDEFDGIVVEERVAEDALFGNLYLRSQIGCDVVGGGIHGYPKFARSRGNPQ